MAAGYVGNGARSERDPSERLKYNKDEIDKMLRTTYGAKFEPDVNRRCREEILAVKDEEGAAWAAAKIRMDLSIDISEAMIEASEGLVKEAQEKGIIDQKTANERLEMLDIARGTLDLADPNLSRIWKGVIKVSPYLIPILASAISSHVYRQTRKDLGCEDPAREDDETHAEDTVASV